MAATPVFIPVVHSAPDLNAVCSVFFVNSSRIMADLLTF